MIQANLSLAIEDCLSCTAEQLFNIANIFCALRRSSPVFGLRLLAPRYPWQPKHNFTSSQDLRADMAPVYVSASQMLIHSAEL